MQNVHADSYFVSTLQGHPEEEGEHQPISINNVRQKLSHPNGFETSKQRLQPEQDMLYDTQRNAFSQRRRTTAPKHLAPLPGKKGGYLAKRDEYKWAETQAERMVRVEAIEAAVMAALEVLNG